MEKLIEGNNGLHILKYEEGKARRYFDTSESKFRVRQYLDGKHGLARISSSNVTCQREEEGSECTNRRMPPRALEEDGDGCVPHVLFRG